jgi:hypothetical protein
MPSGLLFGMPVLWHVVVMGNRDFGSRFGLALHRSFEMQSSEANCGSITDLTVKKDGTPVAT